MTDRLRRLVCSLILAVSFVAAVSGNAGAATPPPGSTPALSLTLTVSNAALVVAGRPATIVAEIRNLGPAHIPVSVTGMAGGQPLARTTPSTFTLLPYVTASIPLTVPSAPLGTTTVLVQVLPLSGCTQIVLGTPPPCPPPPIAQGTVSLTAPEAQHVRISGSSYVLLGKSGPTTWMRPTDGYTYVRHPIDCQGSRHPEELTGSEQFFYFRPLPDGAQLEGVDFIQYWPPKLGASQAQGDSSGNGRYGASAIGPEGDVTTVQWYATCKHAYKGIEVDYSISFRISIPPGLDLGEPAVPASAGPPYVPPGYLTQPAKP